MRKLWLPACTILLAGAPLVVRAQSADDRLKALETYRSLPAEEREWAAKNPKAVERLGELPAGEQRRVLDTYERLPDDEKRQLRENADELQALSPEERRWALDHPDQVRQLGELPPDQRKGLVDVYRNLPDGVQEQIRDRLTGDR
ncbi:MAG: hypothetical protein QOD06_1847 [Candidatus Binatota bacterium]|jgi:hypothetical protein|nr:hypothetical protein [Candidatus Binatota bacterium]